MNNDYSHRHQKISSQQTMRSGLHILCLPGIKMLVKGVFFSLLLLLTISLAAQVTVSGHVTGNDVPNGINGANVSLVSQNFNYNTHTGENGTFSIDNVQGAAGGIQYELTISYEGYRPYRRLIEVRVINLNLQTIRIDELAWAPSQVSAREDNVENVVNISWEAAIPSEDDGQWLNWDNGINRTGIGSGDGMSFIVASRYTAEQLQERNVDGMYLTAIRFYPREVQATYTIKVYRGGRSLPYNHGREIISQRVANVVANQWNEIVLDIPVIIPDYEELWFGYEVETERGHPAGVDSGPAANGYGNLVYWYYGWATLLTLNNELDYNWNLQAFAGYTPGDRSVALGNDNTCDSWINQGDQTFQKGKNQSKDVLNTRKNQNLISQEVEIEKKSLRMPKAMNNEVDKPVRHTRRTNRRITSNSNHADYGHRDLEGYNIYRLNADDEYNPERWTELATIPATATAYTDTTWSDRGEGLFRYAVQAVYTNHVFSFYACSNTIYPSLFAGGIGTADDPWQIETAEHLDNIREFTGLLHSDKHFVQTADIDLGAAPWNEAEGWNPIGFNRANQSFQHFSGSYDGAGYIISNLTINNDRSRQALFCTASNAIIKNVGIIDANVRANERVGGVVADIFDNSVIESCYVTGIIRGRNHVGGISGWMGTNNHGSVISNCYSTAIIKTTHSGNNFCAGGILGYRNRGDVIGNYAVGPVYSDPSAENINAVIGFDSGRPGSVISNYWNNEATLRTRGSSRGVMPGNTPLEMLQQETFERFDFDQVWRIDEMTSYPYLIWQGESAEAHNYPLPLPPSNLQAEGSLYSIIITWDTPNENMGIPYGYNIYRDEIKLNQELVTETDYLDADAAGEDSRDYYVTSVFGDSESYPSLTVSASAFTFAAGTGTEEDPYQIATVSHLDGLRFVLDGHFRQTKDISLQTYINWVPIGSNSDLPFSGTYDGNGFAIRHLAINGGDYAGLFCRVEGSTISNLYMENVSLTNIESGGAIAARASNSLVTGCYVQGRIIARNSTTVGGFIGFADAGTIISNSGSNVVILGYKELGGFVGRTAGNSSIYNSFGKGAIAAASDSSRYIGGLVGYNQDSDVSNSYYRAAIAADDDHEFIGGLIGANEGGTVTNSYWDIEISGVVYSAGGSGRLTEEMIYPYSENCYVNWDFNDIWNHDIAANYNNGYPALLFSKMEVLSYPALAINPYPENREAGVSVDLESLKWSYIEDFLFTDPVGFRIYLNDSEDFNENTYYWVPYIEGQRDYSHSDILPDVLGYKTTFYWKVVPTTSRSINTSKPYRDLANSSRYLRDAKNVPVWSFTTVEPTNVEATHELPALTELYINYPNPFNPETTISFSLAEAGDVTIEIFNIKGQRIVKLVDEYKEAGNHRITWNSRDQKNRPVASGVYLYRMRTGDYTESSRMILMK